MDANTIFDKTAKAGRIGMLWGGGLSSQAKRILSLVDGKQSVEQLLHQSEKLTRTELQKILLELEKEGYIHRMVQHEAEPEWLHDMNAYSIAVEEIDAADLNFSDTAFSPALKGDTKKSAEQQNRPDIEPAVKSTAEIKTADEATAKAKREAERKAKAEAAEKVRREAAEHAKRIAEAEAKARQEMERIAREKAEAVAKAQAEEQARQKAEAERKAKVEAEERARAVAEQKARHEAEEKARLEAERIAREQAEAIAKAQEAARLEAERKAKAEAEERTRVEAQRKAQAEAAEKAKLEAERRAREEAEELARIEAERQAQEALAEKSRQEAERIAREQAEAEERARIEAEQQAQALAAEQARLAAERRAREEAEALAEKARLEAERIAREQAEAIAKAEEAVLLEPERKAEAEERARVEAERIAQAEAAEQARLAAEQTAREEAEALAKIEAERKAQEALAEKARQKAEEQARLDAERIAREQAEAIAKAQEAARLEAERKAQVEAEERTRIEAERKAQAEAAEQARLEVEQRAREEAEEQARIDAERKALAVAAEQAMQRVENLTRADVEAVHEEIKRVAEHASQDQVKPETVVRSAHKPSLGQLMNKPWIAKTMKALPFAIPLVLILMVALVHVMNLGMLIKPIEKLASASVGEPVTVREVHAALFPQPRLVLTDVAVGSKADIKVGKVTIVSGISLLFDAVKHIKSVELDTLTLRPAELGRQMRWINQTAKTDKLEIRQISLKNLSLNLPGVEFEPFNGKLDRSADGVLSRVELTNHERNLTLVLTPQSGGCALALNASLWKPPLLNPLELDGISAKGMISQGQASFSQIEAKAYGGTIRAQGVLSWSGNLTTSGNFELIKITMPRLLSAFGSGASIDGMLNAKAAFSGSAAEASALVQALEINANFELLNGKVNKLALSHAVMAGVASKAQPGSDFTRFDTLAGSLLFKDGQYAYRQLALKTEQFQARGNLDIDANKMVSGKVSAELTSKTVRKQASFNIGGELADLKLQ